MTNPFNGKRLDSINVTRYLQSRNIDYNFVEATKHCRLPVKPILQNDYGQMQDCSLICITMAVYYWAGKCNYPLTIFEIYTATEKIARKYMYNGDSYGTIPFYTRTIYQQVLNYFNLKEIRVTGHYGKSFSFSQRKICNAIDAGKPVLLSMLNDGRKYYKNHSVLIIGYSNYTLMSERNDKIRPLKLKYKTMLMIYDCWTMEFSYLDFDKVSNISSIVF